MGSGWHEWPLMIFTVFGQCVAQLRAFAKAEFGVDELQPWDIAYYSEKQPDAARAPCPAYNFHIFHLVNRNQRRISRIRLHTHSPRRPQQ